MFSSRSSIQITWILFCLISKHAVRSFVLINSEVRKKAVIASRTESLMCDRLRYRQSRKRPIVLNLEQNDDNESMLNSSDWINAELTLLNSSTEPDPSLDALQVVNLCCRSLQLVDNPTSNAGLERCFPFFSWQCRKAVTARQGGDTVERFCKYGVLSPALQPFMGAQKVNIGDMTIIDAKPPIRGAIATFPVEIKVSPLFSVTHMSGTERKGVTEPAVMNMVIRLEQQRRPPNQNCWLVREIMDIRMAFAGDSGNAGVAS